MQEMKTIIRDVIGYPGSHDFSSRIRMPEWQEVMVSVSCTLFLPFECPAADDRIVLRRK